MNKIARLSATFGFTLPFQQPADNSTPKYDSYLKAVPTLQKCKKKLLEFTFKALEFKPQFNKPFCDAKIQTKTFLSADAFLKDCLASVGMALLELDSDEPLDLKEKLMEFIVKDNSLSSSNTTPRKLDKHKKVINEYKISEREFLRYLFLLEQRTTSSQKLLLLEQWRNQVGNINELIDTSYNKAQNLIMDIQSLETTYGKKFFEYARTLSILSSLGVNLFYPEELSKDLLLTEAKLFDGCCFGMTHAFASLYKEKTHSGLAPLDAIKQITGQFSSGASLSAEKTQFLFYYTINDLLFNFIPQLFDLITQDLIFIVNKIKELIWENTEEPLFRIKNLSPGEYEVRLQLKDSAHAILLIKTMNKTHFIFDPNYGTFAIDEKNLSTRLENLANFYDANRLHTLKI